MSVLLVFLLFAVLQLAAILYLRSIADAAAADGARYAANAGIDPAAGGARASESLAHATGGGLLARTVHCTGDLDVDATTGLSAARVTCHGSVRSVLLPIAAFTSIRAVAESMKEGP